MPRMRMGLLLGLAVVGAALPAQSEPAPTPAPTASAFESSPVLDDSTFEALWQHVVPCASVLEWRRIPWVGTLAEGVVAAQAADKPILLWAMNGHPLACT